MSSTISDIRSFIPNTQYLMMRILFGALFCLVFSQWAFGQTLDEKTCENRLEEAKRSYSSGQLDEVSDKIKNCLEERPLLFSREKTVVGYKLLTESYLFRNVIDDATTSFEQLLTFDPLFEADTTDPNNSYDLIYLSRTYRRKPMISIYGNMGANYSRIEVLQNYATDNISLLTNEDYNKISVGYNAAIGMEIPVWRDFTFAIEGNFAMRTYRFVDSLYTVNGLSNPRQDEVLYGTLNFREQQFWIDIPVMIRYEHYLKKIKKIIPYAYIGITPNFLMSASLNKLQRNTTRQANGGGAVNNNDNALVIAGLGLNKNYDELINREEHTPLRNVINLSAMAGLGAKFRAGRNFIVVEARYNRFIFNSVNQQNRYNRRELVYDYAYVDNDFRMDNFSLTVGFEKSFYKPRKKRKFDPIYVDNRLEQLLKKEKNNAKRTTDAELKRELNSFIRDLERDKPGILEDVRRGRASSRVIQDAAKKVEEIKN